LWLIEKMGLASIATKVMSLADENLENDEEVRKRAQRMLEQWDENADQEQEVDTKPREVSSSSV
jgi:hypothetical protein